MRRYWGVTVFDLIGKLHECLNICGRIGSVESAGATVDFAFEEVKVCEGY